MSFAAIVLIGCVVDALVGWPDRLYRSIGHPVTWIGALITALDARLNAGTARRRFWLGCVSLVLVVGVSAGLAGLVQSALPPGWPGWIIGGLLAWPLIAIRAMHDHVAEVARPLAEGDLPQARQAVSMIVGRNPESLDDKGISRAALESLAENTSDGIVAPVFWGLVAGLPGLVAYKAINTLDSMIGHRSERYAHFGKASARVDDLVNLIPARLSGLLFAAVSGRCGRALRVMRRDATAHRSPNAGWPESAVAGALDVRLSGPRVYENHISQEPWLNAEAPDPTADDLARGLALYRRAMAALILALLVAGVITA